MAPAEMRITSNETHYVERVRDSASASSLEFEVFFRVLLIADLELASDLDGGIEINRVQIHLTYWIRATY